MKGSALRCILVNGAQLKTDTNCTACGERIGGSYVRQIGARKIFCGFGCYQDFVGGHSPQARGPGWWGHADRTRSAMCQVPEG